MVRMPKLIFAVGLSVIALSGAYAGKTVYDGQRFLSANLRPDILDRKVTCWEDAAARDRVAASEARRDREVVRSVVIGAADSNSRSTMPGGLTDAIEWNNRIEGKIEQLDLTYSYFWTPIERQRLFDYIAEHRPMCSAIFGKPTT